MRPATPSKRPAMPSRRPSICANGVASLSTTRSTRPSTARDSDEIADSCASSFATVSSSRSASTLISVRSGTSASRLRIAPRASRAARRPWISSSESKTCCCSQSRTSAARTSMLRIRSKDMVWLVSITGATLRGDTARSGDDVGSISTSVIARRLASGCDPFGRAPRYRGRERAPCATRVTGGAGAPGTGPRVHATGRPRAGTAATGSSRLGSGRSTKDTSHPSDSDVASDSPDRLVAGPVARVEQQLDGQLELRGVDGLRALERGPRRSRRTRSGSPGRPRSPGRRRRPRSSRRPRSRPRPGRGPRRPRRRSTCRSARSPENTSMWPSRPRKTGCVVEEAAQGDDLALGREDRDRVDADLLPEPGLGLLLGVDEVGAQRLARGVRAQLGRARRRAARRPRSPAGR